MNCLDAETLAAWMDGGLKGAALADVQAHVAGCERCQQLLGAMGRTRAALPAPIPERAPRRWLAWAVPAAAAATAIAVWVAIPEQRNPAPAVQPAAPLAAPPSAPAVAPELKQEAAAPPPQAASQSLPAPPPREQARAAAPIREAPKAQAEAAAAAPPAVAAPAAETAPAPPPAARADAQPRAAQRVAPLVDTFAPPPITALCGAAWSSTPADVAGQLTAGSAPMPNVCWVVGRGGVIRRSTNRQTWEAIGFPEMTDLSGVQAFDARTATVTTVDGRSFQTSDGGLTWVQQ